MPIFLPCPPPPIHLLSLISSFSFFQTNNTQGTRWRPAPPQQRERQPRLLALWSWSKSHTPKGSVLFWVNFQIIQMLLSPKLKINAKRNCNVGRIQIWRNPLPRIPLPFPPRLSNLMFPTSMSICMQWR